MRGAAARADIADLKNGLDHFNHDVGRYPSNTEGIQALLVQPPGLIGWKGSYVNRIGTDPWGRAYFYRQPGIDGGHFDLFSAGPDGYPDTTDDVK